MHFRMPAFQKAAAALMIAAIAFSVPSSLAAAVSKPKPDLYYATIKCMVVNSYTAILLGKVNQPTRSEHYKALAEEAHGIVHTLGKTLGYSESQISGDMDASIQREMPRLANGSYYQEAVARCRALKLTD